MMNNKIQYILIALCSVLGACSSEEVPVTIPQQDTETMTFSVAMNGDNSDEVNVVPYFKKGDQIRLYNPVSYSTPDFTDDSQKAYIYECDSARTALDEEYPYKFIPFNNKGFKWKNLNPTSIYYMFEAAYPAISISMKYRLIKVQRKTSKMPIYCLPITANSSVNKTKP